MYGDRYLPRKFKIGIVIPPNNDCDIFSQDLGFIAIAENGKIAGYNVVIGGGLGSTFGNASTYPRTGNVIGFCLPDQVIEADKQVLLAQRDNGNRQNRRQARLKYTIDRMGLENFVAEVQSRLDFKIEKARPFKFTRNGDNYGWLKGTDGKWHQTYFVEGGRVKNVGNKKLNIAVREVAAVLYTQLTLPTSPAV